ncbi:YhgE/Pip family protein [Collinsella sp. HCP3S3_D1]|uniref:YhgE/Pip family protein n=1 Tax=Collinsella sp. HCP3S3_D1 TaxID=3438934 RepID=UPI003F8A1176
MKNILHLFKRDVQNVSRSVIGLIVVMGLIIVPCLYAWFNIAGSWDPYGNTGNLKIAVVNTDEGYESDLIPVEVNVGENVTATLRGNENFDWVVLNDRDKAIEGVKSGAYYAAVVIPKTFSADMMTLFSTEVKRADIEFYENQKANAIAQIVTEKGSSAVQSQVNETFTKTITTIGLKTVSSLLDYMSTDQVSNFIANLSSTLGDSVQDLQGVQASATSLAGILSSTSDSLTSASGMLKQSGSTEESVKQLMQHAESGIADSEQALKSASDAIDAAIDGSAGSFDNVSTKLAEAFYAANQHVNLTVSQLNGGATSLKNRADKIADTANELRSLADQVSNDKLKAGLEDAAAELDKTEKEYRNNANELSNIATSLTNSMVEVNKSRDAVDQAIADAKAGISGAKIDYDSTFSVKAKELKKTISGVLDSLDGISGDLDSAVDGLTDASGSLSKGLSKAAKLVNMASDQLGEASDKIGAFKDELDGALMSDDLATIKTMIGNDPEGLAASLSGPVALDRKPVYPIRNYGSAMAPFYTILSLWVGSIVLAAMMKVSVDDELINELIPVRLHEIYLGRYLFFGGLALLQATLVCAGDILFFGIQCDNPLQFVLAGWVASLVFSNIVYTLTVSFGDIGKALAVVLLVMQVGGSGGTFPIEMTGPVFQAIYPFLPFTHGINAMHAAMAGAYHMEYWVELGILASYLIPSLALGVVFRRPVIKANDWIIEKLESTKLI